eukprot:scaffold19_cov114-Cylindrotheca_fusiformis.AAC.37
MTKPAKFQTTTKYVPTSITSPLTPIKWYAKLAIAVNMIRRFGLVRFFLFFSILWTVIIQSSRHPTWTSSEAALDEILASGPIRSVQSGLGRILPNMNSTTHNNDRSSSNAVRTEPSPQFEVLTPARFTEDAGRLNNTQVNPKACKCVHCKEDPYCGNLWDANELDMAERFSDKYKERDVHVVVSHCRTPLDFIPELTKGVKIVSIHIISKCGHPVEGAPPKSTIEILPNVGRCDHSYAHYLLSVLDQKLKLATPESKWDDAVVLFLKDTRNAQARNLHQPGRWNTIERMVKVASSKHGFSCGILPGRARMFRRFTVSAYFEFETLRNFTKTEYKSRNNKLVAGDNVTFESDLHSWELFYNNLGAGPVEDELVQVCLGGIFAASVKSIKKVKKEVWKAAERSLSRGDNIQEGHYMERIWALLFAAPLERYQVEALRNYTNTVFTPWRGEKGLIGALVKKM